MQLMEHAQLCIIPVPIGKGDGILPNLLQRFFQNADI